MRKIHPRAGVACAIDSEWNLRGFLSISNGRLSMAEKKPAKKPAAKKAAAKAKEQEKKQ